MTDRRAMCGIISGGIVISRILRIAWSDLITGRPDVLCVLSSLNNLTVAEAHTFAVGAGQWVVHNCPAPLPKITNITHPDPISMDEALRKGIDHTGSNAEIKQTPGGNYQWISSSVDSSTGNIIRKIARVDVNMVDTHIAVHGPHLNIETHITDKGGKVISRVNEHYSIDPSTIRPGDHP